MLASNPMPEQAPPSRRTGPPSTPRTSPPSPTTPTSRPSGSQSFHLPRLLGPLLLVLCVTKVCLLLVAAVNSRYVADEYIQADYSRYAEAGGFYDSFQPIKTVLYAYYFRAARELADSSVELMFFARLQGFVLAVGMVLLVYAITRRLGADRVSALFAVLVLLAFSNFMERSFRVRSDNLATVFALAGLWVAVGKDAALPVRQALRRSWRPLVVGLLVGAAFLSTQKAVYHALALGLGYLALGARLGARRTRAPEDPSAAPETAGRLSRGLSALAPAALFSAGWVVSVLLYAVYFGGTGVLRVLERVFLAPRQVALHGGEVYRELWVSLYHTVHRNQLALGLCLLGLVLALRRWRRLDPRQALSLVVAAVLTVLVMTHNQPWQYVFVLMLPFLAPWALEVIDWLAPAGASPRRPARPAVIALFAALLLLSFPRNFYALRLDNSEQDRVAARAESLLAPGERYADGLGMLPNRPRAGERWWWDAATKIEISRAAARGDFTVLHETLDDQPKLWLITYRLHDLRSLVGPFLSSSYLPVDPNILLSGAPVDRDGETRFVAAWAGRYGLYDRDGKPLAVPFRIDGREVSGEVELAVGTYRLQLGPATGAATGPATGPASGPASAVLLPAGLSLAGPLPAPGPPVRLFADVYD